MIRLLYTHKERKLASWNFRVIIRQEHYSINIMREYKLDVFTLCETSQKYYCVSAHIEPKQGVDILVSKGMKFLICCFI